MSVQLISQNEAKYYWSVAEPLLKVALKDCKDYNINNVKQLTLDGHFRLIVDYHGDKLAGAVVIRLIPTFKDHIAYIVTLGGKHVINKSNVEDFLDILRSLGASRVQGAVDTPLLERLWSRFGLVKQYVVVERKL